MIIRFFAPKLPLSAVIISLNAASQIGGCLDSVAFCDEILVVDSGSTDETVALATSRGARVVTQDWLGYGRQKQYAVATAMNDWVICLDADERVSEQLRQSIEHEMSAPRAQAFAMPRCNRFLGRWLRHGEGYPDWSLRLFHRNSAKWSDDAIHEKVLAECPVLRLRGDLLHDSAETLDRYLAKQNLYTTLQAEQLHAQGRSAGVMTLLVSPLARFSKFYFLRLGFLDGLPGLIHICIGSMNSFNKYAKLVALGKAAR